MGDGDLRVCRQNQPLPLCEHGRGSLISPRATLGSCRLLPDFLFPRVEAFAGVSTFSFQHGNSEKDIDVCFMDGGMNE